MNPVICVAGVQINRRNNMKELALKLAVLMGAVVVWLLPPGAHAADRYLSGVSGQVAGGPGGVWNIFVSSPDGTMITSVETDEAGSFRLILTPGNYVLTPFYWPPVIPGQPTPDFIIKGPATPVKVLKDRVTHVELPVFFAFGPTAVAPSLSP
jgi:hypothetical protein